MAMTCTSFFPLNLPCSPRIVTGKWTGRGNAVTFACCVLGKCLISFSEKLPELEKRSKMKMVRQA